MNLGAGRFGRSDAGPERAAVLRDVRHGAKSFHVVDQGRMPQVAVLGREWRADARRAALAFERLDQRRLLAADVGTSADVNGDVEIETGLPQDVGAQQLLRAPALQNGLQGLQQVAVFTPQVKKTAARAQHVGGDGHALEHRVSLSAQQHAVLEGAGFTFVGIAHHDVLRAGGLAAQLPFEASGKTGAAAPAQIGALDLGQRRISATRQRLSQRSPRRARRAKQHIGPADVVLHLKPRGWPLRHWHTRADQLGHVRHPGGVQPGEHLMVVDQQGRPLIAQPGAGGPLHADLAIGTELTGYDPQALAQVGQQCLAAQQAVGHVVAEQHAVGADRPGVQEAVKTSHPLHLRQRQAKRAGDLAQGVWRQPAL